MITGGRAGSLRLKLARACREMRLGFDSMQK
jgi:hypothetical protein